MLRISVATAAPRMRCARATYACTCGDVERDVETIENLQCSREANYLSFR